ncbi:hypothetical protein LAT59_04640, partial [Candidatus Gracilibacteria bacterium]|nr:hypothetical protein [Candidatus Gracilibacteria bacterium]
MKKTVFLTSLIILVSLVFSSGVSANMRQGEMEQMLKIHTQVQEMNLNLPIIESRNLRNIQVRNRYNELKRYDGLLRDALLKEFQRGNISETSMADITHNYRNFIYFTNRVFLYHEIEEQIGRTRETVSVLQNGYEMMRTYYMRVKFAVNNR